MTGNLDIIIIGGGPAGSRTALRLAEMGHSVAVIERKKELDGPVCCTGIVSEECLRSFGIDGAIVLRRVNSARVFSPSGKVMRLYRQETQAGIVDRGAFNAALAGKASQHGADYLMDTRVERINISSDRVRVEIENGPAIEAKAAVIATGFNSRLTETIGLGRPGDFVIGAQAMVAAPGLEEVEIYLGRETAPGFFAWFVPTSPGKALVGLLSRSSPGPCLRRLLSSLAVQGRIVSADVDIIYSGIPLRPLPRTCTDRVLVVGTAAGQVKPTTGGGVCYGMLCADVAAGTLHQALEDGVFETRKLAGYEKAWRQRLGGELRVGYLARRLYESLGDAEVDSIFDMIIEHGIDRALLEAEDVSFDWHGGAVMKLLGHTAVSAFLKKIRQVSFLRSDSEKRLASGEGYQFEGNGTVPAPIKKGDT